MEASGRQESRAEVFWTIENRGRVPSLAKTRDGRHLGRYGRKLDAVMGRLKGRNWPKSDRNARARSQRV